MCVCVCANNVLVMYICFNCLFHLLSHGAFVIICIVLILPLDYWVDTWAHSMLLYTHIVPVVYTRASRSDVWYGVIEASGAALWHFSPTDNIPWLYNSCFYYNTSLCLSLCVCVYTCRTVNCWVGLCELLFLKGGIVRGHVNYWEGEEGVKSKPGGIGWSYRRIVLHVHCMISLCCIYIRALLHSWLISKKNLHKRFTTVNTLYSY